MRTFSVVLEEYLTYRDHLNSGYYDNKSISSRSDAQDALIDLAQELDEIVQGVKDE